MPSIHASLNGLTDKELAEWAGSTIRSRAKSYVSSVSELSLAEDGRLVAFVAGSREYVTTVRRDESGAFDFTCTCPYDDGGPCKHVVAVLLAAMARVKRREEIPALDPDSDLYLELSDFLDDEADEADDGDEWYLTAGTHDAASAEIVATLAEKSRDELLEIMSGVVRNFPSVARWLQERDQLATGKIEHMVQSLRKEIRVLTVTDVWSSDWEDNYDSADYANVEVRLQALLDNGYADAVFELGQELWERCSEQVAHSDDDGELATSIGNCMSVVLKALPRTKLSRVEQLVWLFDSLRNDEYEILDKADKVIDDPRYIAADWHGLALELEERLRRMPLPGEDAWRERYRRSEVVAQLQQAYERAKERERVLPLLESEAQPCLNYEALVDYLIGSGDFDRARFWCIEGYGKTIEKVPGSAEALRKHLVTMAEKEGKADMVAAYRAQDFFRYPSEDAFSALRDAAEKIGHWPAVREAAFEYLQSGRLPFDSANRRDAWPLPQPEVGQERKPQAAGPKAFPKLAVLIDIAILEARHDDVIALFDELRQTASCGHGIRKKVAEAVRQSHPESSLQIWRGIVDSLIAEVKPSAYEEASGYLRKMREIYRQLERLAEWSEMLAELRTRHKPKRNLMALLKEMEQEVAALST